MQAASSQAELLCKDFKIMKEKLKFQTKDTILEKYGSAADEDKLPRELLLGQSERQLEYDRAGRIIKGQEAAFPKSKYEENIYINNHTTVWGSWWKDHQWGYSCRKQTIRNSYCTGAAGIEAASDLMNVDIAHNESAEGGSKNEKDERKRKYNVKYWDDEVTAEDMEAYRMKKVHHDDPMKNFLH